MQLSREEEGRGTTGKKYLFQCLLTILQGDAQCWPPAFHGDPESKWVTESWRYLLPTPCFTSPFIPKESCCGKMLYRQCWDFLVLPQQKAWLTIWPSIVYFFSYTHTDGRKNLPEWWLVKDWMESLEFGPPGVFFLSFCSGKTEQGSCPSDPLYPPTAVLINLVILFCLALVQNQTCRMKGSFGIIYQCNSGNSGLNSSFVLLPSETTMNSYLIGIIRYMFP